LRLKVVLDTKQAATIKRWHGPDTNSDGIALMVFSSPLFLFLFLPLVLACTALPGLRWRNWSLLLFSVLFYAWGEFVFVFLMLGSTVLNYLLGLWVERQGEPAGRRRAVAVAVILNVGTLAFFKYANFFVGNLNELLGCLGLGPLHWSRVRLPIGISFFTFHALSYVLDIYRGKAPAARNPRDVALYIFFFPQLIAGPILRWSAIAPQIASRVVSRAGFAEGVRRFAGGLAKKMLVANVVAMPVDQIFALPQAQLTPALAWLGVIGYTLQIYFDFSGYSDMAVGLGKMFGFQFLENFDFPYVAQSIKEFWRRWHISLSSWFRDYLYIPLGGNRGKEERTYLNLVIVFFLCGLWHGAKWTFVAWGLYHGLFLVLERMSFGQWLEKLPRPLRHCYALLVVMVGWVLFRAEDFGQVAGFLFCMAGANPAADAHQPLARYLTEQVACSTVLGALFSIPAWAWLKSGAARLQALVPAGWQPTTLAAGLGLELGLVLALLAASAAWLAGGTYNPFIYFRF
jgi:alginate O-acetyltransferase complex protein AlgI